MSVNNKLQKKWIDNFVKSPFVNKETKRFNKAIAWQCFYGKNDESYPDKYPSGYEAFYNSPFLPNEEKIETTLRFLDFIGVKLKAEKVEAHLTSFPSEIHKILQKTYYLLKRMANHSESLDIYNPFIDNYWDIQYFIKIETGQSQLTIFEVELPVLHSRNAKIPDGYENDPIAKALFSAIENSNDSFFITGKAGTGKSTFIHYFTQKTNKKVALMAFTGIAAMNVNGVTIHSFFRFPFQPMVPGDEAITIFKEEDSQRKIIEEIDTILIDEISMLRSDLLQAIDYSLRNNGGNPSLLFGGKQMIFVGDIFQLPPVTKYSDEVERHIFSEVYKSHYFFHADAFKDLNPHFFEFKIPKRQKDDLAFVRMLDLVRTCQADQSVIDQLNERFDPTYIPDPKKFFITLTTNNTIVDDYNSRKLHELPFTKYEFKAAIVGDFDEDRYPTSAVLALKQHAQVMFTKNDPQRRWVNGTIGKIEFITEEIVEVRLADGNVYPLTRETWEHRGYKYDRGKRKITSDAKGTFHQFPIKLAWAITIHKSQGLTFDNVVLDLGTGAFVNGQLYTALSRCRTLNGLVLKRKITARDIIQDQRLIDFYAKVSNEQAIKIQ